MSRLKIGDIVARKSYGEDVLFKVAGINEADDKSMVTLRGLTCRLEADAPENDLVPQSDERIARYRKTSFKRAKSM